MYFWYKLELSLQSRFDHNFLITFGKSTFKGVLDLSSDDRDGSNQQMRYQKSRTICSDSNFNESKVTFPTSPFIIVGNANDSIKPWPTLNSQHWDFIRDWLDWPWLHVDFLSCHDFFFWLHLFFCIANSAGTWTWELRIERTISWPNWSWQSLVGLTA